MIRWKRHSVDQQDQEERIRWMCYLSIPDKLRLLIEQEDLDGLAGVIESLESMKEHRLLSIVKMAIELKSKHLLSEIELYRYSIRDRGFFS